MVVGMFIFTKKQITLFTCLGSCHKRQKPQAPTMQAPIIRNRQTRKVANAQGLNRNTNLTKPNLT